MSTIGPAHLKLSSLRLTGASPGVFAREREEGDDEYYLDSMTPELRAAFRSTQGSSLVVRTARGFGLGDSIVHVRSVFGRGHPSRECGYEYVEYAWSEKAHSESYLSFQYDSNGKIVKITSGTLDGVYQPSWR